MLLYVILYIYLQTIILLSLNMIILFNFSPREARDSRRA